MTRQIVVVGPPGTGKTTAMTRFTEHWFKSGVDSREIAYLAFTKAAANEAAGRIMGEEGHEDEMAQRFPYFRTIHSLAYRGLIKDFPDMRLMTTADMKRFSEWSSLEGTFVFDKWEDIAAVFQRLQGGGRTMWDNCLMAYTISRISCTSISDVEKSRLHMHPKAMKAIGHMEEDVYRCFVSKYETYKNDNGLVDFTDMLVHGLTKMAPISGVRKVVIDEAQDLSPICMALCDRIFQDAELCFWAGDEDQCQPAGTTVTLNDGSTLPIELLKVGQKVRTFDRRAGYFTGRPAGHGNGGGTVSAISKRLYSGKIFQIKAGDRITRSTNNHLFVIRWTEESRASELCVTYIMKQGARYRLGWCQLFNKGGRLHLNVRARLEKADEVWILSVHENRTDASIHESVTAAKYGIPTVTFEPVNGANHLTRESIDLIFSGIGDCRDNVKLCLETHGRNIELPFINLKKSYYRKKTTLMEVSACNLITGLMCVPLDQDSERPNWKPIEVSTEDVIEMEVYGLNVEKTNTYVADGIGVHNCIYNFSGADSGLFVNRYRNAFGKIMLQQTKRFPQEIWTFADKIIHRVGERIEKTVYGVPGSSHEISIRGDFEPFVGPALILHRLSAGCQGMASLYRSNGMPFRNERGDDPLGSHKRVENFRTLNDLANGKSVSGSAATEFILEFMPSALRQEGRPRVQYVKRGAMKKLKAEAIPSTVTLYDLQNSEILTGEGAELVRMRYYNAFDHSEDFEFYHRVIENGYKLTGDNMPTITTIHGSKGRQAKKVVLFSQMSKKCWEDPDSEHRLAFVGATRTEGILQICAEQTVDWASEQYDYPIHAKPKEAPHG